MTKTVAPVKVRSGLVAGICLLAGLYLMVGMLALFAASLFLPVILALSGHVNSAVLIVSEFVAVGSVPGVMVIYYCVFTLRRSDDQQPAVAISRDDAPGLWEVVDEVAATVRTRPPTRLLVAAAANAAVFEETRLLGPASGRRYLTIGMPLLLGMTSSELRAVLAHEMGHYARGHTRLGAQVYRGSVALRNTCQALRASREPGSHRAVVRVMWRVRSLYAYVAYWVFAPYSAFYDRVSFAARRGQELQADACAAANFGPDVTADALRAAHALPAAWSRFRDGYLEPLRQAGFLPDEPFSAFEAMLSDPDYRDVIADLRQFPPEEPASPRDSHPALAQRLAALATLAAPAASAASAGAAIDLLTCDQRRSVSDDLRGVMFRGSVAADGKAAQRLPWREWVSTAAALRAVAPAADLVRVAGRQAGLGTATLHTVLDLLASGQGSDLAEALVQDRGDLSGTAAAALTGALYALTGHYLVEAGRAQWAASWTGPSRLIAADIAADELSDLIIAAVHRPATEVPRLRLHLASLGVDPVAAMPAVSLSRAATGGPHNRQRVRITTRADLVTAERVRAIRLLSVVVGVITASVALAGLHARDSSSSPPYTPFAGPLFTPGSSAQIPNPLTSTAPITYPPSLPGLSPYKPMLTTTVVVQPGDTLSALACHYLTTVRALQQMNNLGRSTQIVAGQRLLVPVTFVVSAGC